MYAAALLFLASTALAEDPKVQAQCAEDLNARMSEVLARLQQVQVQVKISAPESEQPTAQEAPAPDDPSSSPASAPPLDTSEETKPDNDALVESDV